MRDIVGELIKRDLGHLVLDIFSHLDAGSVAAAQSVSKTWVSYFGDLDLWKKLCLRKFKHHTEFRELCKLNGYNTLLLDGRGRSNTFKDILLAANSDFSRWSIPIISRVPTQALATCFACHRNHVIFAKTSGDVHVMDLDRLTESVLLPGGGHSRVHSLLVASRGLVLLGLGDGWVKVISMEDGSHVCQMNVQDPENLDVTPGHVSHICHVTRDTRDHVTVVTSGGLLCSWVMGHQPEPVFCIRMDHLESLITLGPQHTAFISPSNTGLVRLINTVTGAADRDLHLDTVTEVPVSLDMVGEILVLAYRDRISLWDLQTSKMITRLQLSEFGVSSALVAMRANATTLAATVTSGGLCLWNLMDILRAHVRGLSSSVGNVGFCAIETQELPYRNKVELTDHKVVFGAEKNLGDFCLISSSSS